MDQTDVADSISPAQRVTRKQQLRILSTTKVKAVSRPVMLRSLFLVIVGIQMVLYGNFWGPGNAAFYQQASHRVALRVGGGSITPINCDAMMSVEPVHLSRMKSLPRSPYVVSFSPWDRRLHDERFRIEDAEVESNLAVQKIQDLLLMTEGAFVDVGANVGFMTHFSLSMGKITYALDPIRFNIAKLCEGYIVNRNHQWTRDNLLYLFHAAAGREYQAEVSITRPAKEFFDQSSLTREAVLKDDVEVEYAPMVRVDDLVPSWVSVGVVKIDVQGREIDVLEGMSKILSREYGYPKFVFYAESRKLIQKTGSTPGVCRSYLEKFGYDCSQSMGGNILCERS